MKKIYIGAALVAVVALASMVWYGCTKQEEELTGTIYGTVSDYATTQPIGGVNVILHPSGEASLTGNDGTFEFNDLKAGNYSLSFSKAEYADLDDDYIIELEAGKKVKRDVQMRKQIASLQITDMAGNPLDTLDFGDEESVSVKTFNIFNNGTEKLSCSASYECEWITNVSGLENDIPAGQTVPVTVRIDRVALADGVNTTFLYIISGNGSNELVVKATFKGTVAITTSQPTGVTATSATVGGNITDDGGRPVTARGICYGTSQTPDIDGDHTEDGSGTGTFSHNITGLSSSTTYYARAYATNRNGTYYSSNIVSFTTNDGMPTVTTTDVTDVTASTAKSGGNVTNNGGFNVTARGVCWNTLGSPDLNDQHTTNGSGTGSYTSNITGLSVGTTYYVRAYATNQSGTSYGAEKSFTTGSGLPTVTTASVSNVTANSAQCGGTISDNGGFNVTARGVCWNTVGNPDVSDSHTTNGTGNGTFTSNMTNLTPSTTYHVRAYATNQTGTVYGAEQTFTTNDGMPQVTTGTVSNITATSAVCSGNVTSDGGITVTAKGFCWSTSQYPTVSGTHSNEGGGTGSFNGSLTNLSIGTTYYVRAYATNSTGTAYGEQISFVSGNGLPVVTTINIGGNVTASTAVSGGNVSDDGGYAVSARGVCWNTLPNPTVNDNHTVDGNGTGYYSSAISGIDLTGSNTYYVRAYATNQNGTSYGQQVLVNSENLEYTNLPTVSYGGYTYVIYPDMGGMNWNAANTSCENLVYGGYDDWFLPSKDELEYIMTSYKQGWYDVDGSLLNYRPRSQSTNSQSAVKRGANYWTCSPSSSGHYYLYFAVDSYYGQGYGSNYYYWYYHLNTPNSGFYSDGQSCRVRPVRKY